MEKNNIETLAQKFSQRFKIAMNRLGIEQDSIKLKPNLSDVNISIIDYIDEEEMKNVILENDKTAYSPYTNTIYIHESFVNAPQLEYHLTKRFLECIATKKEDNKIFNGISTSIGQVSYNSSLNNAINEHLANIILMTSIYDIHNSEAYDKSEIHDLEEDPYKNNMLERKNLFKIEEIVGSKTIIESYLNSDYIQFEREFEKYGVAFGPIAQKMDKLSITTKLPILNIGENDETLQYEIDKELIGAYAKKIISEHHVEKSSIFKEHIVSGETVRAIFGDKNKHGYKNVDMNVIYYEKLISGLEFSNQVRMAEAKTM